MEIVFRNFDNWDRYYDRNGKLLHGCVQFMVKDGTTEAAIYDSDFTPIANPQITDAMGRTEHQVFIADDVLAYFYKYVGDGSLVSEFANGIDTSDQSKWVLQYTIESVSIDQRSITGESSMGVPTMDDLRALDPTEVPEIYGNKIVCLQGYYKCGDCEPVYYYWDSESTANDDNGGIIKYENLIVGRWILVQPTEHCDSRHFGVFPQDSAAADVNQEVRITQLFDYCNQKSIRPYFNGSVEYPYFIYDTIRVLSRNPIDVSEDVVFVDKMASTMGGDFNGNPKFENRNTTVTCKTVRLSWQTGAYPNCQTFIIDTNYPVTLSDMKVVMEVAPNGSTQLYGCQVESNHKISNTIVMQNMEVREEWFAEDYDWSNLSSYSNTILLRNFSSANTYVKLKNKQHEANYGDLGEQTLSGVTLLANCIAENAAFDGVTIQGATELHNVSGTVTVYGNGLSLNAVDCWLSFTAGFVAESIAIRRGSLSCGSTVQLLGDLYADTADINMPLMTRGHNAEFNDCKLLRRIDSDYVKIVDSEITGALYTHEYTADNLKQVNFYIENCFFNGGTHTVTSGSSNTTVTGIWINNSSPRTHQPIVLDMTNLYTYDSMHTYRYENNKGGFLERNPIYTISAYNFFTINDVTWLYHLRSGIKEISSPCLVRSNTRTSIRGDTGWVYPIWGVWVPPQFTTPCKFFAIGKAIRKFKMTISMHFSMNSIPGLSFDPAQDMYYSFVGTKGAEVADPFNHNFTEFGGEMVGNLTMVGTGYSYPPDVPEAAQPTIPPSGAGSSYCDITVEVLKAGMNSFN